MNLFRGAEYLRFFNLTKKEPLTFYDMNLSAQDHQIQFVCDNESSGGLSFKYFQIFCLPTLFHQ